MQFVIHIRCAQCDAWLKPIAADTADMPAELQKRLNEPILAHRKDCPYYRKGG